MIGIVDSDCNASVHEKPSIFSEVVCELSPSTRVEIDEQASTQEYYKICTPAGVEGYCLKIYFSVE